jgi:hypothetical protein
MAFRTAKVESANQIGFRIGFRNNLVQSRNERKRLGFSVVSLRIRSRYQYPHGCTGATEWFRQSFQLAPGAAATREVLHTNGTSAVAIYSPDGAPDPAWKTSITSVATALHPGWTYVLHGRQINGLSQAVIYGPWSPKRSRQSPSLILVRSSKTSFTPSVSIFRYSLISRFSFISHFNSFQIL